MLEHIRYVSLINQITHYINLLIHFDLNPYKTELYSRYLVGNAAMVLVMSFSVTAQVGKDRDFEYSVTP